MPELPEVETVRRGLRTIIGRRIDRVEVHHPRSVRRSSAEELAVRLEGATVTDVTRRGKYLFVTTDSDSVMMIHLRMSGQILVQSPHGERPRHCHVVLTLAPDSEGSDLEVRFVDPRTFGEVVAVDQGAVEDRLPELSRLGPDPIEDGLTRRELARALSGTRRPVKVALLDQRIVAGIGNIYGDEILHRAGVSPFRAATQVGRGQLTRLHGAIHEVLNKAIACGGSTLGDAQYIGVDGRPGAFQNRHRVYGRAGSTCVTCGRSRVDAAQLGGRTTCWCRFCQR